MLHEDAPRRSAPGDVGTAEGITALMKASTLVLAGTTLVLAATSAALLQQVRTERARVHAEATLRGQWEARFRDLQRSRPTPQPPQPAASASTAAAAQQGGIPADTPSKSSSAAHSRDERFLALLATPAGHAQLLAEEKSELRRVRYPDLARALRLTSEQENQILSAEAEQSLKEQARFARCRLDPSCSVDSILREGLDTKSRQKPIEDLLGAEKFNEYESYLNTIIDRRQVKELRARLSSANALSDEQAEALVAAMHEERERFGAEAKEMGRGISYFGTQTGGLMAATEATGSLPSDSEVLSSAREFSQRLRDRAAKLLTTEQMRQFDELQEETLTRTQWSLRQSRDARPAGQ